MDFSIQNQEQDMERDVGHRLLNLVPTPSREVWKEGGKMKTGDWEPGYSLSPATENWAKEVLCASSENSALAVGFVGATSAGKSWLISKLQSEGGARPSKVEGIVNEGMLQSVTSDINLYVDPEDRIYYIDFEGTHGTQPLQLHTRDIWDVVQQCSDMSAWESKRRQALKDSVQPAVAYLMCNIVVFLTREKLVCRRALEECEQFALAANKRVLSALPPALIIVQNCCRPSEGFFDTDECTKAFKQAHIRGMSSWEKYFRSIDCFCIPDEFTFCKRSGFDGEEVCTKVIASLRSVIRRRLVEDTRARRQSGVLLTQLQWFPVLSTLCSIINDRESVEMSSIYIHASAAGNPMADLKSTVLHLMNLQSMQIDGSLDTNSFQARLEASIGIVARFAVLRELSDDELEQVVTYLMDLFPCGAAAPSEVERADGRPEPALCGQNRLFHNDLHRSSVFVRTVNADWLQGLGEWLTGGMTYAWSGEFVCHHAVSHAFVHSELRQAIVTQIGEYRVEKCLEGLSTTMGAPWVIKAYNSLRRSGMSLRHDTSRTCTICTAKGEDPGIFWRMLMQANLTCLPVCTSCHNIMEQHGLCEKTQKNAANEDSSELQEQRCAACAPSGKRQFRLGGNDNGGNSGRLTDHRLHPCKCPLCSTCAEKVASQDWPTCPICGPHSHIRWISDERALLVTGWRVVRANNSKKDKSQGICVGR